MSLIELFSDVFYIKWFIGTLGTICISKKYLGIKITYC